MLLVGCLDDHVVHSEDVEKNCLELPGNKSYKQENEEILYKKFNRDFISRLLYFDNYCTCD